VSPLQGRPVLSSLVAAYRILVLPTKRGGNMEPTTEGQRTTEPLVELAPDESVVRALAQSAHPVEWVESNPSEEETGSDES